MIDRMFRLAFLADATAAAVAASKAALPSDAASGAKPAPAGRSALFGGARR
ncbi:hypothetical protein [Actinacidiphila epipremni]|jgi:hypothetical protein|uniref:Uncharacterized protein n=1 Tax=Actinacidiphila epipremni TaxID=2053013 RepID=A0ABX0ZQZ4_9ACTN|nr:hypothetical protein [Actinacidiphila epipremni]NJP46369.1 hypothetical protein [Actinacidiphila epipremni]